MNEQLYQPVAGGKQGGLGRSDIDNSLSGGPTAYALVLAAVLTDFMLARKLWFATARTRMALMVLRDWREGRS